MSIKTRYPVQSRNEKFADRISTRLWKEEPAADNPYIAERCLCHGYDTLELMRQRGYADVLYLLFRGELPTPAQSALFETLLVALINPGPRHPASRAAMNAGAGKTDRVHILPIALSIMGGRHLGGAEVESAMRFLRGNRRKKPLAVAEEYLKSENPAEEGDWHIAPGFGPRFGGIDIMSAKIAKILVQMDGAGPALKWGDEFSGPLRKKRSGWLITGVAAAVFLDLGFHPREGGGLFQLVCAPGLLAHGLEFTNRPLTALPFVDQEHYIVEA